MLGDGVRRAKGERSPEAAAMKRWGDPNPTGRKRETKSWRFAGAEERWSRRCEGEDNGYTKPRREAQASSDAHRGFDVRWKGSQPPAAGGHAWMHVT